MPAASGTRAGSGNTSIAAGPLARRLRAETRGEVLFDPASRGRYATDASIYQIMPVGVFVPRSEGDVALAIDIARDAKIPVLARGGGTSQCGQTVGACLVVDASKHLRRVLAIDPEGGTAIVQPGVVLDDLNAQLKPHGLWFPVDVSTGAQATLGGMAGNNSCGSRSIEYGNMVHNVLAASAWLSDGEQVDFGPIDGLAPRAAHIAAFVRELAVRHRAQIEERWPRPMRRVGGYNLDIFDSRSERPYTQDRSVNLAHLLIGSEGTLAFTRSLTLKLARLPRAKVLAVISFPTFRAAMDSARHIVALAPTAVELVDRTMIELSLVNPAFRPLIESALVGAPAAILLVEFAGDGKSALSHKLEELAALMGDLGLPDSVVRIPDDARQAELWEVRKAGLNIMMSLKGDGKPVSFIEDCAVPLEHLADYTDALTQIFARHGTHGTWYAHASVGTLHVRPILDMRRAGPAGGVARMRAIAEEAAELVRKFKGAFSGEHGDGLCRGEWIQWQFGPAICQAFGAIKRELDPIGLFNPGRIVDPPKMDDESLLRFAPPTAPHPYRTIALKTALDWSEWNVQNDPATGAITPAGSGGDSTGGLAKAVEMCNNNGHCRKFDAGTMCPSFRVTRDEQHVTRGRANTLRLALSGQLGPEAFTSEALHEALELCVGCKGCRRECPTGVDMAKMKTEFLAHYKQRHGYRVRELLVAHLPQYARIASRVAWLPHLFDILPARLGEKVLGFAAGRQLPRWRADTFWRRLDPAQFASRDETLAAARADGRVAVLFVDTFNGTFEPENALAAAAVLRAAGYTLYTPQQRGAHLCCGRTFLSVGMVERARSRAAVLLEHLLPFAQKGVPIVGLEPSCLLTLRDEVLAMRLGQPARIVAAQAQLFEEFLTRQIEAGRCQLPLLPAQRPLLVHGHCHQKAFGAFEPVLEALRLIPGAQVEPIVSSCCGMAGAFGYEAEHYEVSMRMAEAALLPALRGKPDALIVADGTSCRQQIEHGAGRAALHAARVLEQHLAPLRRSQ